MNSKYIMRFLWNISLISLIISIAFSQRGIITPPPRLGSKPVIANNIVYYLDHVPDHCRDPFITQYKSGGIVRGRKALLKRDNPHIIYGNIEIPHDSCLYIEPGCVLRFGPGFGIIVNGTLIARGSEEEGGRILMTKDRGDADESPTGNWNYNARLSNGNTTQDGRLDLLFRGKWRAVCTNHHNFTDKDLDVTCHHLGFLMGNFTYHSFADNLTNYILWEKPSCTGTEDSLFDCPGVLRIQHGAHVCDGQQVIGFECEGLRPGLAADHWRGVAFFNSTSHLVSKGENFEVDESWSWLEYVDIEYAGLDTFHGRPVPEGNFYPISAISASPLVPLMNNVTVKYTAYDAFNLTDVTGPVHIANCTIHRNRGHGLFIKTSVGMTLINQSQITDNWGDGIKFHVTNLTIHNFPMNFSFHSGFCFHVSSGKQMFPIFLHVDAVSFSGDTLPATHCIRKFTTLVSHKVTLDFLLMEKDPEASGTLTVRDFSESGHLHGEFDVANGSFPQSVRSNTRSLWMKFTYHFPKQQGCQHFKPCLRFLLRLSTTAGIDEEFRLVYSKVSHNIGHGVSIQDMRYKVLFNTSEVSYNQHGAGILVYQGAGEVIVNNTLLTANERAGINITYSGGYQLVNNTHLVDNRGYGIITEYLQVNRSRFELMQKMEVVRCTFSSNDLIALRVGNYCRGGSILINESYFRFNNDEAIEYLSCNRTVVSATNFTVAFSEFSGNVRHAVLMRPLLNTVGLITNSTFVNHTFGAVRVDNGYDLLVSKWYGKFPVNYSIFQNVFSGNRGRYVINLRLTQASPFQKLYFKFNNLRDNFIQESFLYDNPRSRANAVVVISSANIVFQRNILLNRESSVRELATHLLDPSAKIDAEENYWGIDIYEQSQFEAIHLSIFDRDDRYNLAQIDYYPALKTSRVYENLLTHQVPEYRWSFARGTTIGGLLDEGNFIARRGRTYIVDRDISLFPGHIITLQQNVTLAFLPSIGMLVHGCLRADGQNSDWPIHFEMYSDPDVLPLENRTATVRLSNGSDLFEGRLEVFVDNDWGTVCDKGWTDGAASLVCLQLGLFYSPNHGQSTVRIRALPEVPILMSWVSCQEDDADLSLCRAVHPPDIICDHDRDVHLRCQEPSWAGVTLPASPRHEQNCETQLRRVHFERAGLLDAETMLFTPALRIDYNYYDITDVRVHHSLDDGIQVNYIHPYVTARLEYMQVLDSLGNGIVTHYPKLDLRHSNISSNAKAGFLYNPFLTEYQVLSVRSMIHQTRRSLITDTANLDLSPGHMTFLLCPPGEMAENEQQIYITEVYSGSWNYRVTVQIIDFFPVSEVEEVTVFDTSKNGVGNPSTKHWKVPDDLVDFPVVSSTDRITVRLRINGLRTGRFALALISESAATEHPDLSTLVFNTTLSHNTHGIQTRHYNSYTNRKHELFHRFRLETVHMDRIWVLHSRREAIHMPSVTEFSSDYIPSYDDMTRHERVATIRYNITHATFFGNALGVVAEHNHVDFSNNIWQWFIHFTRMERTRGVGLSIDVPRVNDIHERMKHTVHLTETHFLNNRDFSCVIKGYYATVVISHNTFERNICQDGTGLLTISGMEKSLILRRNSVVDNSCRYMFSINIDSHAEYLTYGFGVMEYNDIRRNRYDGLSLPNHLTSPTTYAVSVFGVQNISANRNLFDNPSLGFEFLAGIRSLSIDNALNVKENFWGRTDYSGIMERIFDFDDWNRYSIADFFPYLTRADFNADLSGGEPIKPPLDISQPGGRVLEDEVLPWRLKPYVINRDLTVMPGVTFTIAPGTELQFMPNVGILVFGRLIARGLQHSRILMRPVEPENGHIPFSRNKRSSVYTVRLRGDTTLFRESGFLELFNTTTNTWNLMCDSQFNEKSAEVVCRQLGKETVNAKVRFTHLYDHYIHGRPQYFLKEFWHESYFCFGDEVDLVHCTRRHNYNLLPCVQAGNYTFVVCGERNLERRLNYWGNIRFATPSYQEHSLGNDISWQDSILEYVDIDGAGILHDRKVGAIQSTYRTPHLSHVNITRCADNGMDVVAPRQLMALDHVNVSNNLGFGFNFLVLNGESSERDSSFLLLGDSTIPYDAYGLVEICSMEKLIQLHTRLILYYKYGPYRRDCVKVFGTSSEQNHIGLRFLQLNMFHEDFSHNAIELFDGNDTETASMMAEITAGTVSDDIGKLYRSHGNTMSVHLHASVSHGLYGFIAEILHLPHTGLTYPDSKFRHTLTQCIFNMNQKGAIQYKNVGEISPSLYIDQCWLYDNGIAVLNLTSSPTVDISLQGTLIFRFASNSVSQNKGGMHLSLHTKSIATAVAGNITNNVLSFCTNGETLHITGHYFQRLYIFQNTILNNTAGDYRDVLHISDVKVNFTRNYLLNNTGHHILTAHSNCGVQSGQLYTQSAFLHNNSTALIESTIRVDSCQPEFENNYFNNYHNDFELESYPIDGAGRSINARNNWWGSRLPSFINGKIWDNFDDPNLVPVDSSQPKFDNRSLVEGTCAPGWKESGKRCYRFMGGALPYFEALKFCERIGGYLADAVGKQQFFRYLLRVMRNANDPKDRVWVLSAVGSKRCTAFEYSYLVQEEDCWGILHPFICEQDPYIVSTAGSKQAAFIIGASVGAFILLIAFIISILWCLKSRLRDKQRLERAASLRSSMHISRSTLTVLSEGLSRPRLTDLDELSSVSGTAKLSRSTKWLNESMSTLNHSENFGRDQKVSAMLGAKSGQEHSRWSGKERRREMERSHDRKGGRYASESEELSVEDYDSDITDVDGMKGADVSGGENGDTGHFAGPRADGDGLHVGMRRLDTFSDGASANLASFGRPVYSNNDGTREHPAISNHVLGVSASPVRSIHTHHFVRDGSAVSEMSGARPNPLPSSQSRLEISADSHINRVDTTRRFLPHPTNAINGSHDANSISEWTALHSQSDPMYIHKQLNKGVPPGTIQHHDVAYSNNLSVPPHPTMQLPVVLQSGSQLPVKQQQVPRLQVTPQQVPRLQVPPQQVPQLPVTPQQVPRLQAPQLPVTAESAGQISNSELIKPGLEFVDSGEGHFVPSFYSVARSPSTILFNGSLSTCKRRQMETEI